MRLRLVIASVAGNVRSNRIRALQRCTLVICPICQVIFAVIERDSVGAQPWWERASTIATQTGLLSACILGRRNKERMPPELAEDLATAPAGVLGVGCFMFWMFFVYQAAGRLSALLDGDRESNPDETLHQYSLLTDTQFHSMSAVNILNNLGFIPFFACFVDFV